MNTASTLLRPRAGTYTYPFYKNHTEAGKESAASSSPTEGVQAAVNTGSVTPNGDPTAADAAAAAPEQTADQDLLELSFLSSAEDSENSPLAQACESAGAGSNDTFKVKSSTPSDSVGQLASELARAETRVDVLQVSSKATRALLNLKMSAASAEGDDAKKINQMIRRYNKLVKRIQKKLKQLSQEEQLENRRKQAMKRLDFEKESQLCDELKNRRSKRRKEEKNYADKQTSEDAKANSSEIAAAMSGNASASGYDTAMANAFAFATDIGMDLGSLAGDAVSFDALA